MTTAHNIALAFLTAQHNAEQETLNEIARLREENAKLAASKRPAKAKAKKNNGAQAAPIHGATVFGLMMPDATFSESLPLEAQVECAKTFLAAMLKAGKRTVEGKLVFQEREARNDQIQAISAFVGYDNRVLFGTQETAARATAYRILNGRSKVLAGPDRETQRRVDLSARGFVAGLPAPVQAKLANLQAQELVSAEALCQHEKDSLDVVRGEYQCELSKGLVLVEQERLSAIREDIKRLTF